MSANCPCDALDHPHVPFNPPALDAVSYRVGDYLAFREAMLRSLPGETQLDVWNPGAHGDLAVQMIEWWAYVADVLTFYNERWINEALLRTAQLPASVTRLIAVLGYRPRPGIGATGTLAAVLSGTKSVTVPAGLRISSKPSAGKSPQTFEVDADTVVAAPDLRDADVAPSGKLSDDGVSVVLQGKVTTVAAGDALLLLARDGSQLQFAVVRAVDAETDPRGAALTRLTFDSVTVTGNAAGYRILRGTIATTPWPYSTATTVISSTSVHLASLTRDITPGSPVVIRSSASGGATAAAIVAGVSEVIWYANTETAADPTKPPPQASNPLPLPHTVLTYGAVGGSFDWNANRNTISVLHAWSDAGVLVSTAGTSLAATTAFRLTAKPPLPSMLGAQAMIESADGTGAAATLALASDGMGFSASFTDPAALAVLQPPFKALFDLVPVSRGTTVPSETLGSGDARVAGQEFVLQKTPLTYLPGPAPASSLTYHSTLRVWVNGIEWNEVASFFAQPPGAHVFVTREDEKVMTHVQFGDGVNGARLPSGTNNVVASYRYGSGADAPDAGTLTTIAQPLTGLRAVHNPVAVGGGSDPDAPAKIKTYAPQSVLTFGRAISADDYESIAAQAPGVTRASAQWWFDPLQQRGAMTVWVGDGQPAADSARAALAAAIDPNRPPTVVQAVTIAVQLALTAVIDDAYLPAPVVAAVRTALLDDDAGLFGKNRLRIGAIVFESEIAAACAAVPGVIAIEDVIFRVDKLGNHQFTGDAGPAHVAGPGNVFTLAAADLTVNDEALSDES